MRTRSEKKRDRNNIRKNFRLPVQKNKNQKTKTSRKQVQKSAKKIKKETDNKKNFFQKSYIFKTKFDNCHVFTNFISVQI